MICDYKNFILEREFNILINNLMKVNEDTEQPYGVYEWDLTKEKTKLGKFLERLPKYKLISYLNKLIRKGEKLSTKGKKQIAIYLTVFLSFVSMNKIIGNISDVELKNKFIEVVNDKGNMITKNGADKLISIKPEVKTPASFYKAQDFVKLVEGGYSDDKADKGNWIGDRFIGTKYGISAPVLKGYLNRLPTKEDMKELTKDDALKIYKNKYWDNLNLNKIFDQSVATIIHDAAVNQGVSGTKKILRKSLKNLGVNIKFKDNPFNEKWINKINDLDQKKLFNEIKIQRLNKYKKAPTYKIHGKGWKNRLNSLEYKDN